MEWKEINWEEKQWEIPAEKIKMKQPRIGTLSKQASQLLEELPLLTGQGKSAFPNPRAASRPLSDSRVRVAMRDQKTMTPHGFRAMGRTLLDEVLGYQIEWTECQLAHAVNEYS